MLNFTKKQIVIGVLYVVVGVAILFFVGPFKPNDDSGEIREKASASGWAGETRKNKAAPSNSVSFLPENHVDRTLVNPKEKQKLLIYLDYSHSMSGYFHFKKPLKENQNQYILLDFFLNNFLHILSEKYPFSFEISTFKETISKPVPLSSFREILLKNSKNKSGKSRIFNGQFTHLPSVFSDIRERDHDLFMIITDNVVSEKSSGSDDNKLPTINDISALREEINSIFNEKYAVWLLGIKSEFNGTYYPEIMYLDGTKKRLNINGTKRPLYFWILSKKRELASDTVANIDRYLQIRMDEDAYKTDLNIMRLFPRYFLKSMPVTQSAATDVIVEQPMVVRHDTIKLKSRSILKTGSAPTITYDYELKPDNQLAEDNLRITLKNIISRIYKNSCAKIENSTKKDNQFILRIDSSSPCVNYKFEVVPILSELSALGNEPWWIEWSTHNDSLDENIAKTLNLDWIISNVLEDSIKKTNSFYIQLDVK